MAYCMENLVIPMRIQMERFTYRHFAEKGDTFVPRCYFFPAFTKKTEIFCTVCVDF